jgi:hypothetical protein
MPDYGLLFTVDKNRASDARAAEFSVRGARLGRATFRTDSAGARVIATEVRRGKQPLTHVPVVPLNSLRCSIQVPADQGRHRPGTTCFWRAVLGLRWFRDRVTPDAVARDHGISRATACRYAEEVIAVLADQAPDLREALERARDEGFPQVILDGTIICADRCREKTVSVRGELIDVWYSGKAHTHGGNIQAVIAPDGFPLWVPVSEPGSVHDITAARIHALPALYRAAATGLPALADPGYDGAGTGIHIPVKQTADGREPDIGTRTRNASSALCAAWANADSRCSPAAGAPCSTSPPAPARSATSPGPCSSSPISSTATSDETAEIASSGQVRGPWRSYTAGAVRCGCCTLLHLPTG